MISSNVEPVGALGAQDSSSPQDYVERLFLPNSRDLVRLLVSFNMSQFHPQLRSCPFTRALHETQQVASPTNLSSNSSSKLARKIQQWQQQRLMNVQAIIDEYNVKGWN